MDNFKIGDTSIAPGESCAIALPTIRLYTGTQMSMPVYVKRGKCEGPIVFVSAAIHGDELNGVEIISRVLHSRALKNMKGTLIAVPMVNSYGVLNQSRYMPDRRDLNRSFPGSKGGSLAGRLAALFLKHIVSKCDYGIDLHTGAMHRSNLPQVRANLDDETTLLMAKSFGVPVLLNSNSRDGSLRESAEAMNVRVLLYEAGEALRFDELAIRAGYNGVLKVMHHLGMLSAPIAKQRLIEPVVARHSGWVRATDSGFVMHKRALGDHVTEGEILAIIKDPYGEVRNHVVSHSAGIIIGKQSIPLVQEGEAMYHIAYFHKPAEVAEHVEMMNDELST